MHAPRDHQAGAGRHGRIAARWRAAAAVTAAAALSLAVGAVPASAAGGYTVTATIPVGAQPDGVAGDRERIASAANSNHGTVSVIDAATSTVTATIGVGTEPDAVAVDPAAGTVYVASPSPSPPGPPSCAPGTPAPAA
jgi:YVTN family beta-propeller protein